MTEFRLPVKVFLEKYRFHGCSVTQSVPSFPYLPAPEGNGPFPDHGIFP
jgi:hypothetical protein